MKLFQLRGLLKIHWVKIGLIAIVSLQLGILLSILTKTASQKGSIDIQSACWLPNHENAEYWQNDMDIYFNKKLYTIDSCLTTLKNHDTQTGN